MQATIRRATAPAADSDALIVLAFAGEAPKLDAPCDTVIAHLYESGEFSGKPGETAVLHAPAGLATRRLTLVGCGPADKFGTAEMRAAAGTGLRTAKSKSAHSCALTLTAAHSTGAFVEAAIEGAILGDYEPDRHKTGPDKDAKHVGSFEILLASGPDADASAGFERGVILAESQNFTRSLVNEPSNLMNPLELASRAAAMAAEVGLDIEVLDEDRMRQIGMGSLLGVSMGSDEPPALIVLRYRPESYAGAAHLGLVGKGVTFDSGGISIKPADGMEKMKYDMAGAGAVLGAMRAIALLKPRVPVTAFCPAVENMISGRAQRPGDIVTTLSGKTVEVLNTDAEGRLILNDAITYAKQLGCTHLVDAATLTGSIVVALGHVRVGAFTNDQPWLDKLLAAAEQGEKMWQMPMDDEYKEVLKSAFADLPNIGTRYGGSISAAHFLKEFADPTPWIHLDIAGTAWIDDAKPHMAKGPSGVCVRTFAALAMNQD